MPASNESGRCCIIIPYWESGDWLLSSLDSIDDPLRQVEVLVIDDGSRRVPARDVLRQPHRVNVRLIELPAHRGIEHALNAGLNALPEACELVARLDCGDLCKNERIAKQIEFLDEHPDCGIVGSWVNFITPDGEYLYTVRHPSAYSDIRNRMFVNCAFTHPAVMFRRSVIDVVGFYPTNRPAAEDYAYFFRILGKYRGYNIPEPLTECMLEETGVSYSRRRRQLMSRIQIILDNFELNPYALYGIGRSVLLLATPRQFTAALNRLAQKYSRNHSAHGIHGTPEAER